MVRKDETIMALRHSLSFMLIALKMQVLDTFGHGLLFVVPDPVIQHAWCLRFAFSWLWDDPGALGNTRKNRCLFRLPTFSGFAVPVLRTCRPPGLTKRCSCSTIAPSFFFFRLTVLGSETARLGLRNTSIWCEK